MSTEPLRCAGALIVDGDGRILVQRRSPGRRHFPGTWDIVGGHLEPGAEIQDAPHRDVDDGLIRRTTEDAFAALPSIGR